MADNQTGSSPSGSVKPLVQGGKIPFFSEKTDRPNVLSSLDMNQLVRVANAVLNMKIVRTPAVPDPTGNTVPTGKVLISDDGIVIELQDGEEAGSNAVFNQLQGGTVTCPAGTSGASITWSIAAGSIGVPAGPGAQTAANNLAQEIGTDRAMNLLVCRGGFNGPIYQTIHLTDGRYFCLGQFTQMGGDSRPYMCFLNENFQLDTAFALPAMQNVTINLPYAAVVHGLGTNASPDLIYVVGRYLAQLQNAETTYQIYSVDEFGFGNPAWLPPALSGTGVPYVFGSPGPGVGVYPETICLMGNRNLVVAGLFGKYGSNTVLNEVAVIDGTAAFQSTPTHSVTAGTIHNFALATSNGYVVCGNQPASPGIAAFFDFSSNYLFTADVKGMVSPYGVFPQSSGNMILAGGNTDYYGALQAAVSGITVTTFGGIMRVNGSTGAIDTSFATYASTGFDTGGASYAVYAIAIDSSDRIYVATNAFNYNGVSLSGSQLIRLNANGTLDNTWPIIKPVGNIGPFNQGFFHVMIDLNGKVVISGTFTSITYNGNSYPANCIVRFDPTTMVPI